MQRTELSHIRVHSAYEQSPVMADHHMSSETPAVVAQNWRRLFLSAVLAVSVVSCSARINSLRDQDAIGIYQSAIRQILYEADTLFPSLDGRSLYIVSAITFAADGRSWRVCKPIVLSKLIQSGLTEKLADLRFKIVHVGGFEDVLRNPRTNSPVNGGLIVNLGKIEVHDDRAFTSISVYHGFLSAAGRSYVLEKKDGVWVVTGNTGHNWIS